MFAQFRRQAPALLILFTAGCFDYSNAETTRVPPGRDVQVSITPEGRRDLANRIGTNVRAVSGRLRGSDSASITIAMEHTTLLDGSTAPWSGEQVVIPTRDMEDIQERTLSKPKTVGILALVTGASVAIALALGHVGASSNGSVGGNPAK
jgi:hypothetical protein